MLLLIPLLLTACDVEIRTELYFSDAIRVITDGHDLQVPITLSLQMPSNEKCRFYSADIYAVFAKEMVGSNGYRCLSRHFDTYLEIQGKMNLMKIGFAGNVNISGLAAVGIIPQNANLFQVVLLVSDRVLQSISQQTRGIVGDQIGDVEPKALTVTFHNDHSESVAIGAWAAFVDEKPILRETVPVQRRDRAVIKASNVHEAYLKKYQNVQIFFVEYGSTVTTK